MNCSVQCLDLSPVIIQLKTETTWILLKETLSIKECGIADGSEILIFHLV
jgi:hypothetical protein